jgi:hypothetical protein
MKISSISLELLKEIYNASLDGFNNKAVISPKDIAIKLKVSRELISKCIFYLNDKELIKADVSYSTDEYKLKEVTIRAKGIDLVEENK